MAKRTIAERITKLEARRDSLEAKLEAHESYSSLEAQGSEGASTSFTDPTKLNEMLNEIENKLAKLYTMETTK